MNILFWDIDGTMIRTSKAGLYAFRQAAEEIWGKPADFANIKAAGMTDNYIGRQIIRKMTEREPSQEEIDVLCRRYEALLPEQMAARTGIVLPQVREILSALYTQNDYRLLLLTGNSKKGAQVKLSHFGLDSYFDFSCSAFADKAECRTDIAQRALAIVHDKWGDSQTPRIYVIGDTPYDIECGKAIGAYTVGVATGGYSLDQLQNCTPWWAVDSLPVTEKFIGRLSTDTAPAGCGRQPSEDGLEGRN